MVSLAGYQSPAYIALAYLYIGNVAEAGPGLRVGRAKTYFYTETAWRILPH